MESATKQTLLKRWTLYLYLSQVEIHFSLYCQAKHLLRWTKKNFTQLFRFNLKIIKVILICKFVFRDSLWDTIR